MSNSKAYRRKRILGALFAYLIGSVCLLLYNLVQTSPGLEEFMEKVNRGSPDNSFGFNFSLLIIEYMLAAIGISFIVFTTYRLFFKKED